MTTQRNLPVTSLQAMYALAFLLVLLLAGCSRATPTPMLTAAPLGGSCSLPAALDDENAIRALLIAEGELVVAQNIDPLMLLWAEDARIVDAKNTPDDSADDQIWDGVDAIRNRYTRIVFPGAPALVDHGDEIITITRDVAQVQSTTTIGNEVAPAGDRWEMVRRDGCWYIASLTYNLEPAP